MPTYEYKCTNCSHKFEIFQSMKDEPLKKCPVCGGEIVRLIGAGAGAIFKGTGFYQTDYKNSNNHSHKSKSTESVKTKTEPAKKSSDEKN